MCVKSQVRASSISTISLILNTTISSCINACSSMLFCWAMFGIIQKTNKKGWNLSKNVLATDENFVISKNKCLMCDNVMIFCLIGFSSTTQSKQLFCPLSSIKNYYGKGIKENIKDSKWTSKKLNVSLMTFS